MEGSEIIEAEHVLGLPPPPSLTVAVAVNGKRKSKQLVKWALEKFVPEGNALFKLFHVRPRITLVPTPMGNFIPISQVRDDVAEAYKKEMEWQASQKILPFKNICTHRQVQADVVIIQSDDVAKALAEEVAQGRISKLVLGASSGGMFSRKLKGDNLSSRISACTPSFCTVYIVSGGKLSSIRPSDSETNASVRDDDSVTSSSTSSSSRQTLSYRTDILSVDSDFHLHSAPLPMQQFQAPSAIDKGLLPSRISSTEIHHSKCKSLDIDEKPDTVSSCPGSSEVGHPFSQIFSCESLLADNQSWISDQASTSDVNEHSSSGSQVNMNFELEKLRTELRHVQRKYAKTQIEAIDASRKWNDLNKLRLEEATKLKEISYREEMAKEVASQEKEKCEAAVREADYIRECAEREASERLDAEIKAMHHAKEKEKLENALAGPVCQYQKFTWEEIVSATSSFSEDLKIGMGAHGTVYKCSLHHTTGAVKVLHSEENQNTKQFLQELEILSKVQHPHLLILLGACPDHGCLVYEYMENGSLEERLLGLNKTPPIPWFDRFRIAWEVASALVFLHNFKPKPIIHRDLKPANILLDSNLVSKIGDVGLSTTLQSNASSVSTMYKDTGPVGTLSYIDPEYQRTGLISARSDVYAFGIVVLQLLTAKKALALAHSVETAIDEGRLLEILDSAAGSWPLEETEELAKLGLSCAELRRKDRPDLKDQVLPALERLKGVADRARNTISNIWSSPPSHFICPILKDVMNDPYVAADGYTYDRKAIQKWLEENDKSPMTNLPLPNRKLLPNYTLMSAITKWKSKIQ